MARFFTFTNGGTFYPATLNGLQDDYDAKDAAHAALATGVHGIPTMASGQGLLWNGTTWVATALAALASPALTGTPSAPTASVNDNTTKLATTAFVLGQGGSSTPTSMPSASAGSAGTSTRWAREDHRHQLALDAFFHGNVPVFSVFNVANIAANSNTTTNHNLGASRTAFYAFVQPSAVGNNALSQLNYDFPSTTQIRIYNTNSFVLSADVLVLGA